MLPIPRVRAVPAGTAALLRLPAVLVVLGLVGLLGFVGVLGASATATAAETAWVLPLSGPMRVTRPFEAPASPYGPGHRGVDLAGRPGQPVLAAGSGTVVYAAPLAGRGVLTVLHEGGLRTTYEPVTAIVVIGTAVTPGQQIGVLDGGHAGCPAAACLHWGLRAGEVYLDPLGLLGGPVRLLPVSSAADQGGPAGPPDTLDEVPFGNDVRAAAGSGAGDLPGAGRVAVGGIGLAAGIAVLTVARRGTVTPGRSPPWVP